MLSEPDANGMTESSTINVYIYIILDTNREITLAQVLQTACSIGRKLRRGRQTEGERETDQLCALHVISEGNTSQTGRKEFNINCKNMDSCTVSLMDLQLDLACYQLIKFMGNFHVIRWHNIFETLPL